jgi:hypothetical protein
MIKLILVIISAQRFGFSLFKKLPQACKKLQIEDRIMQCASSFEVFKKMCCFRIRFIVDDLRSWA